MAAKPPAAAPAAANNTADPPKKPTDEELEKYLNIKTTIMAAVDATGVASAITVLVQAIDNHTLRHRTYIKNISYANVFLLGFVFVLISFAGILKVKSQGQLPGSWRSRYCEVQWHTALHYTIGIITIATTGLAMVLAALSGQKFGQDASPSPSPSPSATNITG